MTDQLPAIVQPTALSTSLTDAHLVPALIADLGEQASWRYVEFFTAHNPQPEHAPEPMHGHAAGSSPGAGRFAD